MAKWSLRRVPVSSAIALLTAVIVACSGSTPEVEPTTAPTTTEAPATTIVRPTTTSVPASGHDVTLFRVDPATLIPIAGVEPITTGDWISGSVSPNGEWVVLNVWIDTTPDTDVVRVVETSSGRVVTEFVGPLLHDLRVGNDGAVYDHEEPCGGHVGRLALGGTSFDTVFDSFPDGFCTWGLMTLLDDQRVAWLGTLDRGQGHQGAALLVGGLSDGAVSVVELPSVAIGSVGEEDTGDWIVPETLEPAVVWDVERNRALVVHADEPAITLVDLGSGSVTEHALTERTSWIDGFLAWLVPAAHAKGLESGVAKSAVLSPSGETLYVGTDRSDLVTVDNGGWSVQSGPQGVEVIDTETWEIITRLEIPVSRVSLSPDGHHLVASGVVTTTTLSTSSYHPVGVFIIDTDTLEVAGQVPTADPDHPDIQFSADSSYLYVGRPGGGPTTIVDLTAGEKTGMISGIDELTVFGEVAMLSTRP